MRILVLFLTLIIGTIIAMPSQGSSILFAKDHCSSQCHPMKQKKPKKIAPAILTVTAIYGAIGTWCYFSWYKNQTPSSFKFLNEGWFGPETYAGGTDKLGHAYSNYVMVRGISYILQWGGIEARYAPWIATALTLTYFTGVEIKDGYGMEESHKNVTRDYGFSWEDLIADVIGNLMALTFIYFPEIDDMFDFRLEYWPSPEYLRLLKRGDPNATEDYSGMYYALWYHLSSIPGVRYSNNPILMMLKYLDIGVGYHAEGFMPKPEGLKNRHRQVYFGITANLQQIMDDLFFAGGSHRTVARQITRCVNEVITLPGSALHLGPNFASPQPEWGSD